MGAMEERPLGFGGLVSGLREVYESGRTMDLEWRRSQLQGLVRLLTEREEDIFDALREDLGKHRGESFRDELGVLVKSVKHTLQNLKNWAAPEKAHAPLVAFPAKAMVVPEPLGVVLIFSCWNLPLGEAHLFAIHSLQQTCFLRQSAPLLLPRPPMAAGWAQPARFLLLLLLAVALAPVRADKPTRAGAEESSAVFQLYGDVYPHGLYYVAMSIGNPAKPYFLDVDTGSDLTWLQCDAPCVSCNKVPHPLYRPTKSKLVPCVDELCASLHIGLTGKHKCDSPQQQCDYEIRYADQGSSLGVLVNDNFALRLANSSVVRPNLAFGCGYDQHVGSSSEVAPTDGVLGLGSGAISLLSQLKQHGITKNVIGHCLSMRGGGFLFFGDDLVPYSRATWAPMARSAFRNYYSPGSASLYFGRLSLGVRPMEVVFDSGSSFTYFAAQPYQALVTAIKNDLSKTLKEVSDPSLPLCWKGKKPFKSVLDVKKEFKSLVLSFSNGKKALMEIPPENYLIVTKYGNACLGILNGSEVGLKDLNIVGDITMQDQMVIYDNERGQIGWIRAPCDRIPKFGSSLL